MCGKMQCVCHSVPLYTSTVLNCKLLHVQTIAPPQAEELVDVQARLQATLEGCKLTALDKHLQENPALRQAYLQVGSHPQLSSSTLPFEHAWMTTGVISCQILKALCT